MNKKIITWVKAMAVLSFITLSIGWAGRNDFVEEVLPCIPEETYCEIQNILGDGASDHDICVYYEKHKEQWKN